MESIEITFNTFARSNDGCRIYRTGETGISGPALTRSRGGYFSTVKETIHPKVKQLLRLCKIHRYKAVSIHMRHPKVPRSLDWSNPNGNVFVHPKREINRWPAIWRIIQKLEIRGFTGNCSQHQIDLEVEPQTWELVKGKWKKIA